MASPPDRLSVLRGRDQEFTGVAFVRVFRPPQPFPPCDPFKLRIYFHTDVSRLVPPFTGSGAVELTHDSIVIHAADGDPLVPRVPLRRDFPLTFGFDAESCLSFLEVAVDGPNDFRNYRLRIDDPHDGGDPNTPPFSRVDPFFNDVVFSFEIGCEDGLDCKPAPLACPEEAPADFPVDYLARDFVSLRNALLDFAAQRHPEWTLPIEADVGSMLMEIFAALGDELSYIQDRYAREAYLETATERRSLRKKARLLDYDVHDGRSATTLLVIRVGEGQGGPHALNAGTPFWALNEGAPPVRFEVGLGLHDTNPSYAVHEDWNPDALTPYWFDGTKQCLEIGATELFVEGTLENVELLRSGLQTGDRLLLLSTDPADASIPSRRHFVHVTAIDEIVDPLLGLTVTRIRWDASDALPFQIDQALLRLTFNVVPATAGERRSVRFVCHPEPTSDPTLPVAVEREGPLPLELAAGEAPERPTIFLFSLPDTDVAGLGFLGPSLRETRPEVRVVAEGVGGGPWGFFRSLLEATQDDDAFTLEDGTWRRIVAFHRNGEEIVHQDYASGRGYTLRFGDGEFGARPAEGMVFDVTYRLNPGAQANVPADSITALTVPGGAPAPGFVESVTNPWPVLDGADPESAADIKLLTPEAYRAEVFFAVKPEDYGTQAERLEFVQRGHGKLRWTGSWNTVFASADPVGSFTLSDAQVAELEDWLDCVRQAGRDVIVKDPKFRVLDLAITICVEAFAYPGQVVQLVTEALLGRRGARATKGFFHPDNFTFGTPLRRSALEAVIQSVPGVRAVTSIRVRQRGQSGFSNLNQLMLEVAPDEIIRLENDPTHPERGSLRILTTGGA